MKIELIWVRRSNSFEGRVGEGQKQGLFLRPCMGQRESGSHTQRWGLWKEKQYRHVVGSFCNGSQISPLDAHPPSG